MQDQENATPTIRKRTPWNKGKLTGRSLHCGPNISGQSGRNSKLTAASETSPCSIWRSKASFVAAMSWRSKSSMSLLAATWRIAQTVRQKKTGRPVRFELSEQTRQAVDGYLKAANKRPGEFLFTGRRGPNRNMTTRQYARCQHESDNRDLPT